MIIDVLLPAALSGLITFVLVGLVSMVIWFFVRLVKQLDSIDSKLNKMGLDVNSNKEQHNALKDRVKQVEDDVRFLIYPGEK